MVPAPTESVKSACPAAGPRIEKKFARIVSKSKVRKKS